MFAFALHEHDGGPVVLARHRLGITPLLSRDTGVAPFAATLPTLLAAGDVDTSIDPVALHHYLSWHAVVTAPCIILTGVPELPPSTMRDIEARGSRREHRYWNAPYERRPEHSA